MGTIEIDFRLVACQETTYHSGILSDVRTPVHSERVFLYFLRFWPLQCIGWGGFALATLPLKLYFFQDIATAIQVTLLREGLGFVLSCGARQVWKHHWSRIDRKPLRQVLLVVGFALFGAAVDLLLVLSVGHRLEPALMQDTAFQIVSISYRALILVIWGLLYFALKGIQARQQLVAAMREAELRMLRTQISPHFFFNALNTMLACSKKEPDTLSDLIQSLAGYLRYTLKHHDNLFVPLADEYEAVIDYLAVEKARFREDLQVETYLDPGAAHQPVPGILLQPLLENAVKHGRATSARPLRIRMSITQPQPHELEISIANTGQWRTGRPPHGFGVGLKNLRQRLQLAYSGVDVLTVSESDGWVCITIRLPVRTEQEQSMMIHHS